MEIILDPHLVPTEKFRAARKEAEQSGSRRRSDVTAIGRSAFKLYFFRDHQ
jgi:hypothetical protein